MVDIEIINNSLYPNSLYSARCRRPRSAGFFFDTGPDVIPGMRTLFERQGWRVVDDPAACELVGPNIFLVSAFVSLDPLAEGLENRRINQLAFLLVIGIK